MTRTECFFSNNPLIISVDYCIVCIKINFSDNDKAHKFALFHTIINEISILKIYNYLNIKKGILDYSFLSNKR